MTVFVLDKQPLLTLLNPGACQRLWPVWHELSDVDCFSHFKFQVRKSLTKIFIQKETVHPRIGHEVDRVTLKDHLRC